jgi:hypothetical protein
MKRLRQILNRVSQFVNSRGNEINRRRSGDGI